MGIMNLLKANWTGKVGQTVGAKWKNKSTIRSYTPPAYTNTPAQQTIRTGFGEMAAFIALFADQLKSLCPLDTKGMSVRNAIMKLNKGQITAGALNPATVLLSRGGLPQVSAFTCSVPAGLATVSASWTAATGPTISADARVVIVAVDADNNFVAVGSALNSTGTLVITIPVPANATIDVYHYLLDYRGSTKVGSPSAYTAVVAPAA